MEFAVSKAFHDMISADTVVDKEMAHILAKASAWSHVRNCFKPDDRQSIEALFCWLRQYEKEFLLMTQPRITP
jgi:hypothetical protein